MQNFIEYLTENNAELADKVVESCTCSCEGCKDGNCADCSCEDCECSGCSC